MNACGDSREQNIQWMFVLLRLEWNVETRSMKQEAHWLKTMGSSHSWRKAMRICPSVTGRQRFLKGWSGSKNRIIRRKL